MPGPANDLNIVQQGFVVFDGAFTFLGRSLVPGAGISITNQDGTSGNPVISLTGGADALETLSDDVGAVVSPSGNNIQLVGHINEAGATKFSTIKAGANLLNINPMSVARWIVDPLGFNGTHTTIASAIASATAGDTIFLLPATYTENLTLKAGVNIQAAVADSQDANTIIKGTLTQSSGSVSISGVYFQTNSANLFNLSGSAVLYLINCYLAIASNTAISSSSSGSVNLTFCTGNISATSTNLFAVSAGSIFIENCFFTNGGASSTASTISGSASLYISNSYASIPITSSNTSLINFFNSVFSQTANVTSLTANGTGQTIVDKCYFSSGTASAISIGAGANLNISQSAVSSSNTNAITGAGQITYGGLIFSGSSAVINTTTQTPLIRSNDGVKVTVPGAYPYTTLASDGVISVDTGSARTITLIASPAAGQSFRIKDRTATAAANNITIQGNGVNIVGSTSASSFVINTNGGSVDLVYDSASNLWLVV